MSRLKGLNYNPESSKRPLILAQATIDIVYDRLGPGLTEELRQHRKEIFVAAGKAALLQQFLTEDIGHPALQQHLTGIVFLSAQISRWRLGRLPSSYGSRVPAVQSLSPPAF